MVMLAVFAVGLLGASWTPWPVLAGAFFVIGSVAAVIYVRPGDLLMVTIVPPLLFGIALLAVKAATASGNVVLSIAEGAAITTAEVAPWLFAGMVLTLVISWARGLRECIRELRQDLRADGHRPVRYLGLALEVDLLGRERGFRLALQLDLHLRQIDVLNRLFEFWLAPVRHGPAPPTRV